MIPRPKFDEAVAKGRCGSQRSGSPADSGLENGPIADGEADGEADDVVELGILLPMTGSWPVGRTIAGAAALAVERINTDASLLRGKRLKFTWLDDGCSSSQGQRSMTDLLRDSNITAVIGPGTERPTPSMRAP